MIEHIRLSLRLSSEIFDCEIKALIDACIADLKLSGIDTDKDHPDIQVLIRQAVTLYCKAHFGFADIAVKYVDIYEKLKVVLGIASKNV